MKPMTARSAILTAVLLFLLPSCSGSREDAGFPGPSGSPMPLSGTQPAVVLPEVIEEEPVRIVMIGDSLTARGDFASYFPEADLCNLGHDGDTVHDVTERLGEIGDADRIFLLCGINSLADGLEGILAEHYRILLDTMAALYPEAEVYVQSVLPVSADFQIYRRCSDETIRTLNREIETLTEEHGFIWVDLYSLFVENGAMTEAYTCDGLHLSEEGYAVWAEAIRPYIAPRNET